MYKALVTGASSGIGKAIYEALQQNPEFDSVIGLSEKGPDITMNVQDVHYLQKPLMIEIDLLINCAGIMPLKESGKVFNVNFWGTYNVIQNLLPVFRKGGCIINVASISGMMADPELPIYAASKAAIISLTISLAKKYAPNIRVNCISPGFYRTNLVEGPTPQDLIDEIPMGFEENPEELIPIFNMIWNTKYMTGTNIVVDGGVSL